MKKKKKNNKLNKSNNKQTKNKVNCKILKQEYKNNLKNKTFNLSKLIIFRKNNQEKM